VSKTHRSVSQRARDHKSAKSDGASNDAYETDADRYPGDVSEEIFWDIADTFIELANNSSRDGDVPVETVNAALMYASARYSAFVAVNQHAENTSEEMPGDAENFDAETVAEYFALQFRKLFDENLGQYVDTPEASESNSELDRDSD